MSNKRRKKKWAKKRKKEMRRQFQLKLLALAVVIVVGLVSWATSLKNEDALAHETQETTQTTTEQTGEGGEVVIQRVTYTMNGQPVAVRVTGDPNANNNGLFYTHTDHLGSVTALSDENENLVEDTRFYPYGETRSGNTGAITDRGFTGHRHNDDLGLIYMNSRYYVPGIGRFASADTIVPDPTDPQSFNRYAYVRNNPVNYIDPSGHCWGFAKGLRNYSLGASVCKAIDDAVATTVDAAQQAAKATGNSWNRQVYEMCALSVDPLCGTIPVYSPSGPEEITNEALTNVWMDAEYSEILSKGKWVKVNRVMSAAAQLYQVYVTQRPVGEEFLLNDVYFDGVTENGMLLDAKDQYSQFINPDTGDFYSWFAGSQDLIDEARRQVAAAQGTPIEWHFNQSNTLDAVKQLLSDEGIEGLEFIYNPQQ